MPLNTKLGEKFMNKLRKGDVDILGRQMNED